VGGVTYTRPVLKGGQDKTHSSIGVFFLVCGVVLPDVVVAATLFRYPLLISLTSFSLIQVSPHIQVLPVLQLLPTYCAIYTS
jgi:hypothetical protein